MKLFAYFLPQFHEIPENDKWWGKGFTEWTNVKSAKPLFQKHEQPKIPLGKNYYDLLDKSTMEWQLQLQKRYGVDGLIYYHYYFNGKLLLEKPAENLLKWTDINQPFFFCWANHPWNRSWEGKSEVIMPLEYGDQKDWEKHFQYLLPFFADPRYEKNKNRPLFCVFQSDFKQKRDMFDYFDKRSKEEGFSGIFFIETYSGEIPYNSFEKIISEKTEKVAFREPSIQIYNWQRSNQNILYRGSERILEYLRKKKIYNIPKVYDGNELMEAKINSFCLKNNEIPSVWFEWDNTPRHKQRGYVILPYKKELFFDYMELVRDKEYLFINAWNEWAEGMMLEPTEKDGYKYLEWIKEWKKRELEKQSLG